MVLDKMVTHFNIEVLVAGDSAPPYLENCLKDWHWESSVLYRTGEFGEAIIAQILSDSQNPNLALTHWKKADRGLPKGKPGKLHAKIRHQLGKTFGDCGHYGKGQSYLSRALSIFHAEADILSQSNCLWDIGNVHFESGSITAAMQAFKDGLKMATQLKQLDYYVEHCMSLCAKHSIGRGECAMKRGNDGEALYWFDTGRKYAREGGDKEHESKALINTSLVFKKKGDHESSKGAFKDAICILEIAFGKENKLASSAKRLFEDSRAIAGR